MKKMTTQFFSILLALQIGLSPVASLASDEVAADSKEMQTPPAIQEGSNLTIPLPAAKLPESLSPETRNLIAGIQIHLGSPQEVEKNRPSLLAKGGNQVVHFTSQYIYFKAVMGLSAMVGLAMNYSNDPIALQNYLKSYTDVYRFGEDVGSFGAFLFADWATTKVLVKALKMHASSVTVQQLGMATGLWASTIFGELWNDKNVSICAKSRGTQIKSCDAAFDSWVTTNRIVQYIPMIVQNTGSALLSGALTNMARKGLLGAKSTWSAIKGNTQAEEVLAVLEKQSKNRWEKGIYLRISNFGMTGKVVKAVAEKGFIFAADLPGAVIGLGMFLAVDAVISSPLMKAYTKNFIDEQNTWMSLRKFKELIGTVSFRPLNWLSFHTYVGISGLFPNYFPKIDDEKTKVNWINEFNIETFLKFIRLWAKYNVEARNESGKKTFLDMLMLQPISELKRDATVVESPQDGFEIMRDAQEALMSSLTFSSNDLWQTYNVNHCAANLSLGAKLTFQEAIQFYIGLNAKQKSCIVDIDIYDNLVSFIDRSAKHRNSILSPLMSATSAWTEALSKFLNMSFLSTHAYRTLLKSKYTIDHKSMAYDDGEVNQDNTPKLTQVTPLTYQGVNGLVKNLEAGRNLELTCTADDVACLEATDQANDGFLPESFWMNDDVGNAKIKSNTDYLIAQMACGPDVKDTSSYWLTAQNYQSSAGRLFQAFGNGFDKVYQALGITEGVKVFDDKLHDPNSAMIYTPAGLYPRFVPPRIVTGNGLFCQGLYKHDNSVATGKFYDGSRDGSEILPFVLSHLKPELMVPNPDNSDFPSITPWQQANVIPVFNDAIAGFQNSYNHILTTDLAPNLLGSKFTDGCVSGQHCFQSWKSPKVSLKVYESMEIEMRVLLGLLNEIYIYPTEKMAKGRDLDNANPLSTSYRLKENLKNTMSPEALQNIDTRYSIFESEASDTNGQENVLVNGESQVQPKKAPPAKPLDKIAEGAQTKADYETMKAYEIAFLRAFKAKLLDMTSDKNGPASFNVEQSEAALAALKNFYTASRVSEINDLQAKVSGLIFRALEGLLQERNSYNNFLQVANHPEVKGDVPQTMRQAEDRLLKVKGSSDLFK